MNRAALVLCGLLLAGCADNSLTDVAEPITETGTSKMRQSHLFNDGSNKFLGRNAKTLERYEELAASNDFVLGMYKILERYRVLERYDSYAGVSVKQNFEKTIDGFAVRVDGTLMTVEAFLALVEADPDIEWIEPDMKFPPKSENKILSENSNSQQLPSNIDAIDGDLSWALSGDGTGTVDGVDVYIMDTGLAHEDLNVVETINFADDALVAGSVWEHGTHVAGTIAAIDDNDGVVGVAPGARIHNLRVLNNAGEAEMSAAIAAVEFVTVQKETNPSANMVVNISFGADIGTWEYNAFDNAIKASIAKGVTYVIAAGNDGIDASTVTPAHVYEAITVAAYQVGSGPTTFAAYSNYGTAIDVLAPGHQITSLAFGSTGNLKMSGTSMAAPHITGAAALYLSKNPGASPNEVVSAIYFATKNDVRQTPPGTTKWRIALDLEPFGAEYFNNGSGGGTSSGDTEPTKGKGGGKNK